MSDKPKIIFLPGAFDDFEGTQQELDELVSHLENMSYDEFSDEAKHISLDELFDSCPEFAVSAGLEMGIFDDLVDENGNPVSKEDIMNAVLGESSQTGKKNLH